MEPRIGAEEGTMRDWESGGTVTVKGAQGVSNSWLAPAGSLPKARRRNESAITRDALSMAPLVYRLLCDEE